MAIANTSDSESPAIILAAVHSSLEALTEIERKIREKDVIIIQKNQLDCSLDEIKPWFSDKIDDSLDNVTTGYVLQGEDVTLTWKEIGDEFGQNMCGVATKNDLQRLFPGIVLDKYLLQPEWTSMFLEPLRPIIMEGLQKMCEEKPNDPVEFLCNYLESSKNTDTS